MLVFSPAHRLSALSFTLHVHDRAPAAERLQLRVAAPPVPFTTLAKPASTVRAAAGPTAWVSACQAHLTWAYARLPPTTRSTTPPFRHAAWCLVRSWAPIPACRCPQCTTVLCWTGAVAMVTTPLAATTLASASRATMVRTAPVSALAVPPTLAMAAACAMQRLAPVSASAAGAAQPAIALSRLHATARRSTAPRPSA